MSEIIFEVEKFVKSEMASNDASHDWNHINRVRRLALKIAHNEGLCEDQCFLVEVSALLHDIGDWKYSKGSCPRGQYNAPLIIEKFLTELGLDSVAVSNICYVVGHLGFSQSLDQTASNSDSDLLRVLHVVQDADQLDGIGAIGVARCLIYGATKGSCLHDPSIPTREHMTTKEYREGKSTTINHFYEKLFKLKDMMKTPTGRQLAEERHHFMRAFVSQFEKEWAC